MVAGIGGRGLVLQTVRRQGEVSRAELVERTGLAQAAVSTIVRDLVASGLLAETGRRTATGGKPRTLVHVPPRARTAVGVQLAAEASVVVLMDARGEIVQRREIAGARGRTATDVLDGVAAAVRELGRGEAAPGLLGVGLATSGRLDRQRGLIVRSRSLPALAGVPLSKELARRTGLPVMHDADATAAALGDLWAWQGSPPRAHATLYMGAGVGLGLVIDGEVIHGAHGAAGDVDFLVWPDSPVMRSGREGGRGDGEDGQVVAPTLGERAGPPALAAAYGAGRVANSPGAAAQPGGDGDPGDWSAGYQELTRDALAGDALALGLLEDSAEHLARAVAAVARLLDLDSVALAGPGFAVAGEVSARALQAALAAKGVRASVRLSHEVAHAAAVGAAALVLDAALIRGRSLT